MNFLALAQNRYTTKKYNPQGKIAEKDIEALKEILRLSPSSINSQPWKFTFVSDEKTKQALSKVSFHNEQKVLDASHIVVFYGIDNIAKFEDDLLLKLPEHAINYYNTRLKALPEFEKKSWLQRQVYISLGFFLSALASMSIDSTAMEGIEKEQYDAIVGEKDYKTLFAVAIGYRDPEDANQPSLKAKFRFPLEELVK